MRRCSETKYVAMTIDEFYQRVLKPISDRLFTSILADAELVQREQSEFRPLPKKAGSC